MFMMDRNNMDDSSDSGSIYSNEYAEINDQDVIEDENIYSNSDAIIFHQLIQSGNILTDVNPSCDSQAHSTYNDCDDSDDDFSVDGEDDEEEDLLIPPQMQPPQENNVQDFHAPVSRPLPVPNECPSPVSRPLVPVPGECHAPARPPFPIPRSQGKEEEEAPVASNDESPIYMQFDDDNEDPYMQFDDDDEDPYLTSNKVLIAPNQSSLPSKGMLGAHRSQSPQFSSLKIPYIAIKEQHHKSRNTLPGRIPPSAQRGPAPLPDHIVPSPKKPFESQTLPSRNKGSIHPSLGNNNSTNADLEKGRSGSFLHRNQQSNQSSHRPSVPWKKEIDWTIPNSSKENDHVYEPVDSPMTLSGVPETSGSTIPDFVDQDLSSRFGAASLKKLPPVSRKHSGGNDSSSGSDSPKLMSRNRSSPSRPLGSYPANGSPFNSKTQENHPTELAPALPNQPYFTLDDGKTLLLTPLYQKLMDKPYFHLLSRSKAIDFVTSDRNGAFLIRPSTKSGNPLTLTLKLEDRPYNINIRKRPDSLFALGSEKTQEKAFSSLDELVSTYSREPIKIDNGKVVYLKHSPAKKGSIYVKHYPPHHAK